MRNDVNAGIAKEAKDQPAVNVNDVKSGWQVRTDDGFTFVVMDNKNGAVRTMRAVEGQHLPLETREDYAFAWQYARESEEKTWRPVVLSENQQRKVAAIKREWQQSYYQ